MLRLFRLPGAMFELAVGTVIVIVHLGLAGVRSRAINDASTNASS